MLCNTIPLLDDCKDAEIRRLCIINFPNRFCENPKLKNEKLIDINLAKKLNECCNEFFQLLISYLKNNDYTQKLVKQKEVTRSLSDYIEKNNQEYLEIIDYLKDTYEYKVGNSNKIKCKDVWDKYTTWVSEKNSRKKIKQMELEELFEDVFDLDNDNEFRSGRERFKDGYKWGNMHNKEL